MRHHYLVVHHLVYVVRHLLEGQGDHSQHEDHHAELEHMRTDSAGVVVVPGVVVLVVRPDVSETNQRVAVNPGRAGNQFRNENVN